MNGTKTEIRPGVWRLRVYVGRAPTGSPIQASKTIKGGSREADRELRRFIEKVEQSRTPDRNATVGRLLEAHLEQLARKGRQPSTIASYRGYMDRHLVPQLGNVRLDKLTARDLDRAYARWLDHGLSPSTVNLFHSIISAALHQAVKWEWVDRAVSEKASPPPRGAPAITRHISTADLATLIGRARENGNYPLAAAVALGAVTGARRGELCALRWSDLDGPTLTIARAVTVLKGGEVIIGQTKTKKPRRLHLDGATLRFLDGWRERQTAHANLVGVKMAFDPYVLTTLERPRGDAPYMPHTLTQAFSRLCSSLNMPYHLHELRHYAATTMIAGGIDPKMASTRLGHSRTQITLDIYAHSVEAVDQRAAELLGASLLAIEPY